MPDLWLHIWVAQFFMATIMWFTDSRNESTFLISEIPAVIALYLSNTIPDYCNQGQQLLFPD